MCPLQNILKARMIITELLQILLVIWINLARRSELCGTLLLLLIRPLHDPEFEQQATQSQEIESKQCSVAFEVARGCGIDLRSDDAIRLDEDLAHSPCRCTFGETSVRDHDPCDGNDDGRVTCCRDKAAAD